MQTKIIVTQVYFGLPNWFPPARYDIHGSRNTYHRRWYKNKALDNLMRLKGAATFSPRQIVFEIQPGADVNKQTKNIKGKIDRLLNRYKEAQEGDPDK
ncbi:MAG: hypothetical protein GY757_53640 [bacterium]|nr:hypothetical protein [bacterium]